MLGNGGALSRLVSPRGWSSAAKRGTPSPREVALSPWRGGGLRLYDAITTEAATLIRPTNDQLLARREMVSYFAG